jgi:hypothetical protein
MLSEIMYGLASHKSNGGPDMAHRRIFSIDPAPGEGSIEEASQEFGGANEIFRTVTECFRSCKQTWRIRQGASALRTARPDLAFAQ